MEEQDYPNEGQENNTHNTIKKINKAIAILFVLAIYLVIFLKILFIR